MGICTPDKSEKTSEFRRRSSPFRSDTTNEYMNMGRLENIGPAPDSGPMGTLAPESLRVVSIMVHRHKKVTN